jgi:hypothetical protein
MPLYRSAVAALSLALLSACGTRQSTSHKAPQVKHVFTHGDPHQIVAGTTLNGQSFLAMNGDTPPDLHGYAFAGGFLVSQKTTLVQADGPTDIEAGQEASDDLRDSPIQTYAFVDRGGGLYGYEPDTGEEDQARLLMTFTQKDGRLELTGALGVPVTMLHYSMKADRAAFSFLFEARDPDLGDVLVGLYFAQIDPTAAPKPDLDKEFNYLLGPGVSTTWSDAIHVDLCGSLSADDEAVMRQGILAWAPNGKIGTRALTIGRVPNPPPFTDLDSQCMMMVDDYLFEDVDDAATLGVTVPVLDPTRQTIVAADVFISRQGHEKIYGPALTPQSFVPTITHEFGHFMGLDHEFDRGADGLYLHDSVMGYGDQETITDFDRDALAALYGPN